MHMAFEGLNWPSEPYSDGFQDPNLFSLELRIINFRKNRNSDNGKYHNFIIIQD